MGFAIVGALFGARRHGLRRGRDRDHRAFVQVVTTLAFAFDGKRGPPRPVAIIRQLAFKPLLLAVAIGFAVAAMGGLPPGIAPTVQALGRASVALGAALRRRGAVAANPSPTACRRRRRRAC